MLIQLYCYRCLWSACAYFVSLMKYSMQKFAHFSRRRKSTEHAKSNFCSETIFWMIRKSSSECTRTQRQWHVKHFKERQKQNFQIREKVEGWSDFKNPGQEHWLSTNWAPILIYSVVLVLSRFYLVVLVLRRFYLIVLVHTRICLIVFMIRAPTIRPPIGKSFSIFSENTKIINYILLLLHFIRSRILAEKLFELNINISAN